VITPTKVGTYPLICTELCGLGHAVMRSQAIVMTPAAFPQTLHMTLAAYAATGFAVAGIHAAMLLRDPTNAFHRHAFAIAILMGAPALTLEQLDAGSVSGVVKAITGRIDLVHCNDSRDEFDSGADRHANFGKGHIDPDLLGSVVREAGAPVVCETPGGAAEHLADFTWLRDRL